MGYFTPKGLPTESWERRQAQEDARLLLMVVRARLREGDVPTDLVPKLERLALDQRTRIRQQRVAAGLLARIRLAGASR